MSNSGGRLLEFYKPMNVVEFGGFVLMVAIAVAVAFVGDRLYGTTGLVVGVLVGGFALPTALGVAPKIRSGPPSEK